MDLRVASQQLLELDNDIGVSDVSSLQASSLIICGGRDVLVHQSLSQKLANELPFGVAWHFGSSGHFILLEKRKLEGEIKKMKDDNMNECLYQIIEKEHMEFNAKEEIDADE